ncbi:MAG: carboxy terminal-processing peptidase [Kiritimatiellaeota bacterium]|nr:carboxy terminal-processing peptidase [Kiritimatiellota bacterium]
MKIRRFLFVAAVLCGIGLVHWAQEQAEPEAAAAKRPFGPQPHYADIAKKISRMLPSTHLLQFPFDENLSRQAWTNLLNAFDHDRSYFLQSDIEKFAEMETKLAAAARMGDVSFGYEVHQVFLRHLENRYTFATNLLAQPFTFEKDESYTWKRKDMPWPATEAERDEIWRKRIKNELLARIISRELAAQRKVEAQATNAAAPAAGIEGAKDEVPKLPPEAEDKALKDAQDEADPQKLNPDATAPAAENAAKPDAVSLIDPPEIIIGKHYKQLLTIMQDMDTESVLQRYLNAFTTAYDPHTEYMSPMRKEDFDIDMGLTLVGIGAQLRPEDGMAKVMELLPGGPAEKDTRDIRLTPGDRIIGVGQGDEPIENIVHWPLNKAVRKIRGKKGTKVVLEVIPAADPSGTTTKRVDLIRDEIKMEEQAATGRVTRVTMPDGSALNVGIVRLPAFYGSMDKRPGQDGYRSATDDVREILANFNNEDVAGLILDLRNNGGGALREAVALTGLFIRGGPAVQVKEPAKTTALSVPNYNPTAAFRRPMIVMINRASASAAEIVAGALQDYGRALIVGDTQSHGKGTVQTVLPLGVEDMGSLKVTTASFYRITGSSTQIKGVGADIVIPSLLDGLDIGEDKLPGALPWSQISPADYIRVADVAAFVPKLREQSAERLAANPKYTRYCTLVRHVQEVSQRTEVPLEINARRQMMKAEEEMRKLEHDMPDDDDENLGSAARSKRAREEDNVVLDEAVNILGDLIQMMGNKELPMEMDGDIRAWRTRILPLGL